MGWYLLRKPYPGQEEDQRVDILTDQQMIFGRGRECTVHCLSLHVSRHHLKIIPKGGCVYAVDLGSSNGTFINKSKVIPEVENFLRLGDEIGLGNTQVDDKNCFVYEVRCPENEALNVDVQSNGVSNCNQELKKEDQEKKHTPPVDPANEPSSLRGLKRPANDEPEVVTLDGDENGKLCNSHNQEVVFDTFKKPKVEGTVTGVKCSEKIVSLEGFEDSKPHNGCNQEMIFAACKMPKIDGTDTGVKWPENSSMDVFKTSVTNRIAMEDKITASDQKQLQDGLNRKRLPKSKAEESLDNQSFDANPVNQSSKIMWPPPVPVNIKPNYSSSLLENSTDTSAPTIRMSSPAQGLKSASMSQTWSTLVHSTPSKGINPSDLKPLVTSTPSISKLQLAGNCKTKADVDLSPIVKDSPKHSSGNYTLEEEMIFILSDDDDEAFPCSQMFEEDVKPLIEDLNKDLDVVDLAGEDTECNKKDVDELDDVILISSDEDEDDIEDFQRWYSRLSQSSVKVKQEEVEGSQQKLAGDSFFGHTMSDDEIFEIEQENVLVEGRLDGCNSDAKVTQNVEVATVSANEVDSYKLKLEELHQELEKDRMEAAGAEERVQRLKETWVRCGTEAEAPAVIEKNPTSYNSSKKKDQKKQKEKQPSSDSHLKNKDRRKHERSDKELRSYRNHHSKDSSKKKDHERKEPVIKKSKERCSVSNSDDEVPVKSESSKRRLSLSDEAHKKHEKGMEPSRALPQVRSEFDMLQKKEADPAKPKFNEIRVSLERLDERKLKPSNQLSGCHQSTLPKQVRKAQMVSALPNPPRKASNRGISEDSIFKAHSSRENLKSGRGTKTSATTQDKKTIRKEMLAKVAANETQHASKRKGNESKRVAPAKIKVTESNRGSFLTEDAKSSESCKPRSRKDIVISKKIPKLKNRPVVSLPAKSPLQAMNMSWEKEKEKSEVIARVCAPELLVPLEIPTGPQPKKRIAQKPPHGFIDDGNTDGPSSNRQPMKSCLSGSSKHNIVLNDSKHSAPKKRVVFKRKLVEVRYIEPRVSTSLVNSFKDADRPRPIPASRLNDDAIAQDVIYDICKWNPLWLKEEKNLPPDVLPPVVPNMQFSSIPKEFLSFEEYHDTMYPFLMLELWNGVSKDYHQNLSSNNMFMAVDSATSTQVVSRPDRMIATLNCHMLLEKQNDNHPKLGNLVIIDLVLSDQTQKFHVNPVFGYVSFDSKNPLKNQDQFHKDLLHHCRNPKFKVRFSLLIRGKRKDFQFFLEKPMRVKNVKYIRGDLRVFQAMKSLSTMPLRNQIISPSAGNEDFSLPDVSHRILAFKEHLNSSQQKIVLQTAEVCQQDKPKICLIQGPPGTGKSHVIANLVLQLLYPVGNYCRLSRGRCSNPRILLCAPSNNAVDLLVRSLLRKRVQLERQQRFKMVRVGQEKFMHPEVKGVSLSELARQDANAANSSNDINFAIKSFEAKLHTIENQEEELKHSGKGVSQELLLKKADFKRKIRVLQDRKTQQSNTSHESLKQTLAIEREAMRKILRGADIVATTLNSCAVRTMETVFPPTDEGKYHFQVCIVDEATQCLEVETLIPLLLGVKTLVLVGDPNQLPATILSRVARDKGLGLSLFARLQKIMPRAVQMLDVQYRMHPEILRWPNKFFYDRHLRSPDNFNHFRESHILPYSVLRLPFTQDQCGESNYDEAKFVLQLAELLVERKAISQQEFKGGIVTPYQRQKHVLNSLIQDRLLSNQFEVSTIDSCQGQEKDIIILSLVRTNGVGFLSDRQRINVALTRAKFALFICGNFSSLDRDHMWNNLLGDARQRKCLFDITSNVSNNDLWNLIERR